MSKRPAPENVESPSKRPKMASVDMNALVNGHILNRTRPSVHIDIEQVEIAGHLNCDIPKWIFEMDTIRRIFVRECKGVCIPSDITNLKNLESLKIFDSKVESIPMELGSHPSLRKISIRRCNLPDIPDDLFSGRSTLESLTIDRCNLKAIPPSISNVKSLVKIFLRGLDIHKFPPPLQTMPWIETLVLRELPIERLPPNMGCFGKVRKLSFRGCGSLQIHRGDLNGMKMLKEVDVMNIRSFDDGVNVFWAEGLESFYFSHNFEVPGLEFWMNHLKTVWIDDLKSNEIPDWIKHCPVEVLIINDCKYLRALPDWISTDLRHLTHLSITNSRVRHIPTSIFNMPKLLEVHIGDSVWSKIQSEEMPCNSNQ